ncbi:unnamed protein product [Phaedon cochleariae]|uniref:C2H2-type domain-containing protein n=1 Tax=Phaedon cochleariae TaxID=80249 RepID=A0A9P0DE55_PHACE|nr:unnamed protein product [Phaedon cochleariae]
MVDIVDGFLGFPREPKEEVLSCTKCDYESKNIDELDEHLLVFHDIDEDQDNKFEIVKEKPKEIPKKKIRTDVKKWISNFNTLGKIPRGKVIIRKIEPRFQITNEVIEDIDHKKLLKPPKLKEIPRDAPTRKRGRLLPNGERLHCCRTCSFTTTIKSELPKHRYAAHSDSIIYRCSQCPYETRRKNDMPKHMLGHCDNGIVLQDVTSVLIHLGGGYAGEVERKCDLPKHQLCHTPTDSINLYKCQFCVYVSKRKGDLAKHMWNHSEEEHCFMTLFNCTECEYVSKRKNDLHKHMLVHSDRNVSEVFKCQKCPYASDKVVKFSKHVLSQCKKWDDSVSLDHLRLEDILDGVDDEDYHVVIDEREGRALKKTFVNVQEEEAGEEEEEYEYVEEIEGEVVVEDQIVGYIEEGEQLEGEVIEVAEGDIYQEEDEYVTYEETENGEYVQVQNQGKDATRGVFKINLGEFSVDVDQNQH